MILNLSDDEFKKYSLTRIYTFQFVGIMGILLVFLENYLMIIYIQLSGEGMA